MQVVLSSREDFKLVPFAAVADHVISFGHQIKVDYFEILSTLESSHTCIVNVKKHHADFFNFKPAYLTQETSQNRNTWQSSAKWHVLLTDTRKTGLFFAESAKFRKNTSYRFLFAMATSRLELAACHVWTY